MARVSLRVEYEHGPGPGDGVVSFEAAIEGDGQLPVDWIEQIAGEATAILTADGFFRRRRAEAMQTEDEAPCNSQP